MSKLVTTQWAAVAVFVVALGLRLWGLDFGLPRLYHPDEPAYVLQALAVARGLPDGLTFANPPLFKYLLLVEYAATFAAQRVVGATHSPQEFVDQFRADPSQLYLIARATSAVCGALTAVAAGWLGVLVGSRRVSLIAGLLTAVGYLLVRDAHFGVNDSLVTLLVTIGLCFCVRIARFRSRRDYVFAGVLAGLAFAAKYYGIVVLAPLVLGHLASPGPRRNRNLAYSLLATVIAAVVAFPSLVTEPARVVNDVYLHLYLEASGGYDGLDPAGGYAFYAKALGIGLGWPLVAAATAGLVLSLVRRVWPSLIVASLPIVLFAFLGDAQLYFARFALPALPALVVEASLALDALMLLQPVVGIACALLVSLPTLIDSVRLDGLLSRPDTRTLAADWIDGTLPERATIAVDFPPLGPTLSSARGHQITVANGWSLFDLDVADYRARGIEYVVESSFTSQALALDPRRDERRIAFARALAAETAVTEFRPYVSEREPPFIYDQIYAPFNALDQLERPGPKVTVYRLTR